MSWQPEMDELPAARRWRRRWAAPTRSSASTTAAASRCASASTGWSTRQSSTRSARSPARPSTTARTSSTELTPSNCVMGRAQDRRPAGRGHRRRLHGARRLGRRHDQGEADSCRALWPTELRLPMIRIIEGSGGGGSVKTIETTGRANVPGGSAAGDVPVVATTWAPCRWSALGLGSVAGLGAARLAATPLLGDGQGDLGDVRRRPAGGERARPEAQQAGAGRLGDPVPRRRDRRRGRHARRRPSQRARRFLSYLPVLGLRRAAARAEHRRSRTGARSCCSTSIPRDSRKVYRMRPIIEAVVDQGCFFEMGKLFGRSVITGLARLDGWPVAVMASDPYLLRRRLDGRRLRRRWCASSTWPRPSICRSSTCCDCPGFLIGLEAEKSGHHPPGRARHGGDVPVARCPWCTVIVRNAFGVAGAAHQPAGRLVGALCLAVGPLGLAAARRRHRGGLPRRHRRGADDPKAKMARDRGRG